MTNEIVPYVLVPSRFLVTDQIVPGPVSCEDLSHKSRGTISQAALMLGLLGHRRLPKGLNAVDRMG